MVWFISLQWSHTKLHILTTYNTNSTLMAVQESTTLIFPRNVKNILIFNKTIISNPAQLVRNRWKQLDSSGSIWPAQAQNTQLLTSNWPECSKFVFLSEVTQPRGLNLPSVILFTFSILLCAGHSQTKWSKYWFRRRLAASYNLKIKQRISLFADLGGLDMSSPTLKVKRKNLIILSSPNCKRQQKHFILYFPHQTHASVQPLWFIDLYVCNLS